MFKFFPDEDAEAGTTGQPPPSVQYQIAKEVLINDSHFKLTKSLKNTSVVKLTDNVSLKCANLNDLVTSPEVDNEVHGILQSSSDLESGVYEGGFKTWECTWDLTEFIDQNFSDIFKSENRSEPFKVLDLGCGSGLLGLAALKMAEERSIDIRVDFQDYNEEVINHVTIPNTLLNFDDEAASKCRFFSGDWGSFSENIQQKYDLMLSSETIYNLEYFDRFIQVVSQGLEQQGALYLAAKTFYFGVGGGTRSFLQKVRDLGELDAQVVRAIKQGVIIYMKRPFLMRLLEGVQREIISIRKRTN